jgi:hypothetical protein
MWDMVILITENTRGFITHDEVNGLRGISMCDVFHSLISSLFGTNKVLSHLFPNALGSVTKFHISIQPFAWIMNKVLRGSMPSSWQNRGRGSF